jgi:hypothetical protein
MYNQPQPGFNQAQQAYINPYIQPGMPTQPESQVQPDTQQVVNSCETAATDEPITAPTETANTAETADFTGTVAFGSEHEEKL